MAVFGPRVSRLQATLHIEDIVGGTTVHMLSLFRDWRIACICVIYTSYNNINTAAVQCAVYTLYSVHHYVCFANVFLLYVPF